MTDAWATANPENAGQSDDNFDPPPDGMLDAALIDAGAFVSEGKGVPWVKMVWRQLGGTEHEWTVLSGFKSQAQADVTKKTVQDLGVDVNSIPGFDMVDAAIREKIGGFYTLEIKTSGKFRNTYIQGPATAPIASDTPVAQDAFAPVGAPAATTTDDEDIPF